MKFIKDIQDAFEKEATKAAKGNSGIPAPEGGEPASKQPDDNNKQGQKSTQQDQGPNPKDNQPATTVPPMTTVPPAPVEIPGGQGNGKLLTDLLKQQYGIDLSEDEIKARLKPSDGQTQPASAKKAVSVPAAAAPRIEDVTDDDVGTLLEANGRSRDLLKRAAEISKVDDTGLVRQFYVDYLKEHHKLKEEDAVALFSERYFIPPEGKEDSYTAEEIAIGKTLLKQEADRLRGQVTGVIEGARKLVLSDRMAVHDKVLHDASVDAFIGGVIKKMTIPIGKSGAKELGEYSFNINDEVINEVAATMKSPALLIKKFKMADSEELDYQRFFDFLVYNEVRENLIKSLASDYHSMGVDSIESTLHNLPNLNNSGKNNDKTKKSAAEVKKEAEDFNRQQINKNLSRQNRV